MLDLYLNLFIGQPLLSLANLALIWHDGLVLASDGSHADIPLGQEHSPRKIGVAGDSRCPEDEVRTRPIIREESAEPFKLVGQFLSAFRVYHGRHTGCLSFLLG